MLDWLHKYGLPQNLSLQGEHIDNANVLMHWLMLFLFIGWGAFFIVSLYKFSSSRNKKASYTGVESHISSLLEGAIAIIEIIALFGFSYPVWSYRVNAVPDSRDAVNIRVIAQQFAWNIHYPGADGVFGRTDINLVDEAEQNFIGIDRDSIFTVNGNSLAWGKDDIILQNQMHVPVNKKIRIDLSSKDVIHNFKLPELRVSQDAIPGMTIPVHFTATMTSNQFLKTMVGTSREGKGLEISCAQLCGITHYRMRGYLTIDTEEEYNDWLASEAEYLDFGDDDEWGDDEDW